MSGVAYTAADGRVHEESSHPVIKPRIMAPTVQNIGLAESSGDGAERGASLRTVPRLPGGTQSSIASCSLSWAAKGAP